MNVLSCNHSTCGGMNTGAIRCRKTSSILILSIYGWVLKLSRFCIRTSGSTWSKSPRKLIKSFVQSTGIVIAVEINKFRDSRQFISRWMSKGRRPRSISYIQTPEIVLKLFIWHTGVHDVVLHLSLRAEFESWPTDHRLDYHIPLFSHKIMPTTRKITHFWVI